MLDPASWLEQAQQLSLGQRRRVPHDCGGGKVLLLEHKDNGFAAWCHRCSDTGWHPHPQPSLAERIARLNAVRASESAAEARVAPPVPTEFNPSLWPLPARVWLYKAGFSNDAIQRHGFYYSEPLDRVVLPVFAGGEPVYWQARGFDPTRPKYLNPDTDKPLARYGSSGPQVICEDVLSAARVGEVVRGVCLLGTSLSDRAATEVLRAADGGPIIVWLDPDSAGRKGAAKTCAKLRLAGGTVHVLDTDLDPKLYSRAEIEEFIQSALRLPSCAY